MIIAARSEFFKFYLCPLLFDRQIFRVLFFLSVKMSAMNQKRNRQKLIFSKKIDFLRNI